MKLNPDCIRGILLTIEENSSCANIIQFKENISYEALSNFTYEEIQYHLRQCHLSSLIIGYSPDILGNITVSDLSPAGHEFLANIREDTNWKKVKNISEKVGSKSLNVMEQIASNVISDVIKAQMGLS